MTSYSHQLQTAGSKCSIPLQTGRGTVSLIKNQEEQIRLVCKDSQFQVKSRWVIERYDGTANLCESIAEQKALLY